MLSKIKFFLISCLLIAVESLFISNLTLLSSSNSFSKFSFISKSSFLFSNSLIVLSIIINDWVIWDKLFSFFNLFCKFSSIFFCKSNFCFLSFESSSIPNQNKYKASYSSFNKKFLVYELYNKKKIYARLEDINFPTEFSTKQSK